MSYKRYECESCGRICQVMQAGDEPISDTECLDCQTGETWLPDPDDESESESD